MSNYPITNKEFYECQEAIKKVRFYSTLAAHGSADDIFVEAIEYARKKYEDRENRETTFVQYVCSAFKSRAINEIKAHFKLVQETDKNGNLMWNDDNTPKMIYIKKTISIEQQSEEDDGLSNHLAYTDDSEREYTERFDILRDSVKMQIKYKDGIKAKFTEGLEAMMYLRPHLKKYVRDAYQSYRGAIHMDFCNFYHITSSESLCDAVNILKKKESEIDSSRPDTRLASPFGAFVYMKFFQYSNAQVTNHINNPFRQMLQELNTEYGDLLAFDDSDVQQI